MFWHSAAICGLSLLLVLSLAPRGFSPVTPVFPGPQNRRPTFPNSNLIWNLLVSSTTIRDQKAITKLIAHLSWFIFSFFGKLYS